MILQEFKDKWLGRKLYEYGGTLERTIIENIWCKDVGEYIRCEVYFTPSWNGFRDDKQKREMMKDLKSAGLKRFPGKKNMYYKRIY